MNIYRTHQTSFVFFPFIPFCIVEEDTLDRLNVGKHTLEDQMDLMNTHLLTSWVWRTHTLGDQMDFGEIHMTTSWIWGIHYLNSLIKKPSTSGGWQKTKTNTKSKHLFPPLFGY